MLRIIPTPENPKVLYTLNKRIWLDQLGGFDGGIYFEYYENDVINFKFFYILGSISILEGPFSSTFSSSEMNSFFDCCIKLSDLEEWLDQVPFSILKCLNKNDPEIKQIWKMTHIVDLSRVEDERGVENLCEYYYEFKIYSVTIRSYPYYWTDSIRCEISDENNKIYWTILCLLKYLRQLKQQSGE